MRETETIEKAQPDNLWKVKALVIGGVLGALTGVGAAFLMTKRAEQQGTSLSFSAGKGVQLGMLITSMLRSILSLGDG